MRCEGESLFYTLGRKLVEEIGRAAKKHDSRTAYHTYRRFVAHLNTWPLCEYDAAVKRG